VRNVVEGLFPVEFDGVDTRAFLLVQNGRPSVQCPAEMSCA
jgi:hypothetical protein